MPVNDSPSSFVDKLERQLAKCLPADKNIVRRTKNGAITYETVRTHTVGQTSGLPSKPARASGRPAIPGSGVVCGKQSSIPDRQPPQSTPDPFLSATAGSVDLSRQTADPNNLPNNLPQSPMNQENGNLIADFQGQPTVPQALVATAEITAAVALAPSQVSEPATQQMPEGTAITCHEAENPGNQQSDPLTELLHRALAATKTRRGHPPAFDDHARGQLVALLSVGMSMRQAASVLGVSHTTVQNTLKADPALSEQITAARFQAQLQPLACVIREARRSWKAATWLLKYLDTKIASHEETPDERRERQDRETEEFHARFGRR